MLRPAVGVAAVARVVERQEYIRQSPFFFSDVTGLPFLMQNVVATGFE
jgi:hypothetical protein